MCEETTNIIERVFTEQRISLWIVEDVLAVFPDTLVDVHPGTVVLEKRFRHEGGNQIVLTRHILDDVLIQRNLIGNPSHRIKADVDLALPCGTLPRGGEPLHQHRPL